MKRRVQYYLEAQGITWGAVAFLMLSFVLRITWCFVYPGEMMERGLFVHVIMPLSASVLFILCILLFGKKHLWISFIPTLIGVAFFLLKATTFGITQQILCSTLYTAVAVLYGLTVFGVLPIRKLLIPLFGLPLLYHIFVEDLIFNRDVYAMSQWLQEGSVLCIMAGLLCIALAMKEKNTADGTN